MKKNIQTFIEDISGKEKCSGSGFLNFISKNSRSLIWIFIFLTLFSSGIRFDLGIALISASINTGSMILLDQIIRKGLIPKYLSNNKHQIHYYMSSFVILYIMIWGSAFIERFLVLECVKLNLISYKIPAELTSGQKIYPYFRFGVLLIGTFSVSTISYLLSRTKDAYKMTNELRNEKLDMELRYLKAQINPHFLFNALNNIYSMSYTNDPNAPEAILKLSEMLRYVMDECQTDKISISKEVKYIESFIDFQRMRVEDLSNVEFTHNILNPDFKITPMIFQPLVENAFKHSRVENNRDGYVKFYLQQTEKELIFITENTRAACFNTKLKDRSGIGIDNVKKRLDLAYGDKYVFDVEENDKFYRTTIKIKV